MCGSHVNWYVCMSNYGMCLKFNTSAHKIIFTAKITTIIMNTFAQLQQQQRLLLVWKDCHLPTNQQTNTNRNNIDITIIIIIMIFMLNVTNTIKH